MSIKTGIYISGSITHDPNFVKKFALAEKLIIEKADPGTAIFNPAANQTLPTEGRTEEQLWADYLVRDLFMLMNIRQKFPVAILVSMPEHKTSKGSSLERAFADRIGFCILDIREIIPDWDERLAAVLPTVPELRTYSPKHGGKK